MPSTLTDFHSEALFVRRLMLRVKLLDDKHFSCRSFIIHSSVASYIKLTPSFTILTYLDSEVLALITEGVAWVYCCYLDSVQDPYQWYLELTTPPRTNTFTPIIVIGGNFKITQSKLTVCKQQQAGNNKKEKRGKGKIFLTRLFATQR